ncbi:MAG: MFS transporter [SAR86 cluster bacterium]|jgi:glycoside/pentoside/hexuronide:cation symporter, GPH family|nr:MFS transporter [SAR86 cluster bacterium]
MTPKSKIKGNIIAAYGGLALPLAMIGYPIAIWLIPFYSEVTKFPLALLADILLFARFTDVITDPVIGHLSDSTNTPFGRRKPWILLGLPLMMISVYFLFSPLENLSIYYFLIFIVLMYLGSTLIGISYNAWGAEISPVYHERSRITAGREVFTLIGLLLSALIPLAVEVSGAGVTIYEGMTRMISAVFFFKDFNIGYDLRNILHFMGLGIVISLPIFAFIALIRVKDPMPNIENRTSLKEGLKIALKNTLVVKIILITFLVIAGESFRNTLSLWFMRDVIGVETIGAAYARYFISGLIAIPFWLWLGKKIGKHKAFSITLITTALISFLNFFLDNGDFVFFHFLFLLKGACFGGLQFLPISMLADVIDTDSLKSGEKRAGNIFALNGMILKIAAMLAIWAAVRLVDFFGFNPGVINTQEELLGLRILYTMGPSIFFLPALYLSWSFPLTKGKHEEIRKELSNQKT